MLAVIIETFEDPEGVVYKDPYQSRSRRTGQPACFRNRSAGCVSLISSARRIPRRAAQRSKYR